MMLAYPRTLGTHPDSGSRVTVQDGPYGPYVKCGKESRSLPGRAKRATPSLRQSNCPRLWNYSSAPRQPRRSRAAAGGPGRTWGPSGFRRCHFRSRRSLRPVRHRRRAQCQRAEGSRSGIRNAGRRRDGYWPRAPSASRPRADVAAGELEHGVARAESLLSGLGAICLPHARLVTGEYTRCLTLWGPAATRGPARERR